MSVLLRIVALVVGFVGLANLTEATKGVGIICGACLLAIFARMAQASEHHDEICGRPEYLAKRSPGSASEGSEKESQTHKLKEQ